MNPPKAQLIRGKAVVPSPNALRTTRSTYFLTGADAALDEPSAPGCRGAWEKAVPSQ